MVTLPRPAVGSFPPPGVTGVVFDVVGTLVEPAEAVADTYAAAGRRRGIDLDPSIVARRFAAAWRRQESIDAQAAVPYATSRERERRRWQEIVVDVFGTGEATEFIFADLWEHYALPQAWRPIAAGTALAQAAIDAGLAVAVASNFDERLLAVAPALDPLSRIEDVLASSEIGWRKPAVAFFRDLERRLGRLPAELLSIGDDPDLDVTAARAAGWQAMIVG
jgi:putative hydrolase of the HAD superfamily